MNKTRGMAITIGGIVVAVMMLATLRVWAAGIPTANALTYSGVLEDAGGVPIAGTHDIEVRFWSAAAAGSVLCSTSAEDMALQRGRFSVPLLDACTDAVQDAADVWVEIIVDATSLGRSKVGAVPYAVEADRAVVAESATVAGRADRLGTLTPASVQQRVSGTCSAGSSIRTINTDGTVVCEDDTVLTESQVDAFANNNGYALAADLAAKQDRVNGTCPAGQSIRAITNTGTVTCEVDDNTTYTAGTGLSLTGTTFSADTTYVQRRVSSTCTTGQAIRAINTDGTVTCETQLGTRISSLEAGTPKVTAWRSESSPAIVWSDGSAAGAITSYFWRRVGDSVEVRAAATFNQATSSLIFGAPPSLAWDGQKATFTTSIVGHGYASSASGGVVSLACFAAGYGGVACVGHGQSGWLGHGWPSGSYTVTIQYSLPIAGWTTTTP